MRCSDTTSATDEQVSVALQLASDGFVIFPASAKTSRPYVSEWQRVASNDPRQIGDWWAKWPNAVPALPTGRRNGVVVLDVDMKKGKDGLADLKALGLDPDRLSSAVVITPSGGRHLYFAFEEGLRSSAGQIAPGLDVRAEGGYVIAPGARSRRGVYEAKGVHLSRAIVEMAGLPKWRDELRPKRREGTSTGEKTGRPFDVIRDALFAIPNDDSIPESESRDWWLAIGMALHHETDGSPEGLAAFDEWSARHRSYDEATTETAWHSFHRDEGPMRTAFHILNLATEHGWRDPRIDEMFDEVFEEQRAEEEIQADIDELVGDPSKARKAKGKSRLTFLSPDDCATAENPAYVVKGLLYEGDIGCIYGQPNHGKSIIAPYLAYRVAQGEPAFGMRVRQGKTFYVAAEGAGGMRKRVNALRRRYGRADFQLVVGVSNLTPKKNGPSQDHKDLLEAIKQERPAVVVIDTIARAFAGLEENSSEGMGNVIHVAQSLTQWGAAVVLIHHPTKSGEHLRGFGGLHGALDMELLVEKDGEIITATAVKARDFADGGKLVFGKAIEVLGQDEDGDDITTVVCVERDADDAPERGVHLRPSAKAAYTIFLDLIDGRDAVPEEEWRKACVDGRTVSASDNADSRAKTFKRAVVELTRNLKVHYHEGGFMRPNCQREPFDAGEV